MVFELFVWVGVFVMNLFLIVVIDGFIELNCGLNNGYIGFESDVMVEFCYGCVLFEYVVEDILWV